MNRHLYKWKGENVEVVKIVYSNGRTGLILFERDSPQQIANLTINVDGVKIEEDTVIVKNYSENVGLYEWMVENNIVSLFKKKVPVGYSYGLVCKLLI